MMRRPRQRRLALGVLLAAVVLAVATFPVRDTWWGGWILAVAEAGIVGGLADWFAVTAIFRRPLRLPIPHTALIPANWELLAARVGTMVGGRVLTKEYVMEELGRLDIAEVMARGAERITRTDIERAAARVLRWLAEQVPSLRPRDVLARVRPWLATWQLAPALASALELAREQGWDQRVMNALAQGLAQALDRPPVREAVSAVVDDLIARYRERMKLYPRMLLGLADAFGLIDRDRLVSALHAGLKDLEADPDHPLRREVTEALASLPARLREAGSPLAARVEAVKEELLASDIAVGIVEDAVAALRRGIGDDLARPRPELAVWLAERLERGRRAVVADPDLRKEIDRWIKTRAADVIDRYHPQIARFIENGVRALGPEGAVRLIEEHAGDDLQYIRVNGTVVGGLAGGAIYGVHLLFRLL
jgi:uncharacterized membrane-anchored protein YjiN (DUF445 family)